MYSILVVLHVLVCLVLCVVILLQSSKGGGLAGAFCGGGGMPQQIFGARGMTTLLHKLTIYCAVGFFVTSATLFAMTAQRDRGPRSVVQEAATRGDLGVETPAPVPSDEFELPPLPAEQERPAEQESPEQTAPSSQSDAKKSDDGNSSSNQ
jgi:preprotein translocase subunit SecG